MRIRHAVLCDVDAILELINHFAAKGEMLRRPKSQVYAFIRNYVVAEDHGKVVGCSTLEITWDALAEIRSLAIKEGHQGKGIGSKLVDLLMQDAKGLGVKKVFALTYKPKFFERFGFKVIDKQSLPHKVWTICLDCDKFPECDEVAVQVSIREWWESRMRDPKRRGAAKHPKRIATKKT